MTLLSEKNFNPTRQLEELIRKYPDELKQDFIFIDIHGVILDFLARTNMQIEQLFQDHPKLYPALFDDDDETVKRTTTLLKDILIDNRKRSAARTACKKNNWPKLESIINDIENSQNNIRTDSEVDMLAGHRVEGVVWQLSDIHFGRLNKLGLNAKSLAETLIAIGIETPEFKPKLILISGDLTSSSQEDEYKEFCIFYKKLSEGIWPQSLPHRILVVPGNHEITWLSDGKADRLSKFKKYVASENDVITPFWEGNDRIPDSLGEISISRYDMDESPDTPPFVLVKDKRLNFQVLLLVSSYYSYDVPQAVIGMLHGISNGTIKQSLQDILREDKGETSREYILHMKSTLNPVNLLTVGLTHHNLDQLGLATCLNQHSSNLLQLLASKDIRLILHGHTHLNEEKSASRPLDVNKAYPIPCPALCGEPQSGSICGFMMHLIGPDSSPRNMSTAIWEIDNSQFFRNYKDKLYIRYRFLVHTGGIEFWDPK